MLGRQQIANLPTALSELFKNAHDAYATMAVAEFFRVHDALAVSDDGVGMDRETFERAWLTIATESKLECDSMPPPAGMTPRVQLGEKGIGRFAIGALGSQVLVLSKRDGCPAVAALVNWKMFELPGIDLDEVPVGLVELDGDRPRAADVARLKAPLVEALNRFRRRSRTTRWTQALDGIQATLDALPDDPYGTVPGLRPLGPTGTVFLVSSVSEDLAAEIGTPGSKDASLFERTLHGFTDSWLGEASTPDFAVDFVDHRGGGDSESLLRPDDFFGPADFEQADHHIHGEFDEDGDFVGTIRIFDEDATDFDVRCPDSLQPRCGPFTFEVGVVQGMASESRLDPEAFGSMNAKLKRLGGLYVYMDGIRVQPYGRPDFDYLEIEERRSFGAGYYFFSYRRMFGAVSLASQGNAGLQEKAGREGFKSGRAYSDFRQLLINLLVQLAATYFRAEAPQVRAYEQGRERLVREDKLRKEREKQAAAGRRQLRSQLASAVEYLSETDFQERASEIVEDLSTKLAAADRLQPATGHVVQARRALGQLVAPLRVDDPEGFAPSGPMRRDMTLVERGAADVEESYLQPALELVDDLAGATETRLTAREADEQERDRFVKRRIAAATKQITDAQTEAEQALAALYANAGSMLRASRADFDKRLAVMVRPNGSASAGWIREQAEFERELDSLVVDSRRALSRVANLLRAGDLVFTSGAPAPTDLAAAADAEIVELRAQADDQLEYVQLGMALAVVDHEFRATVASIRRDVRRVGSWAKKNPQLAGLYEDLRRDFDHLDSYLTLLTPMQRRLRRTKTTIKGSDISRFLNELFRERLRDTHTEIRSSREFEAAKITGYASTFYPVFINLVDNSLYWIRSAGPDVSESLIELSKSGDTLIYRDTGPGIGEDIAERVFDFGFTTKPGGSGLGLAIASQVLDRAGWSIGLGSRDSGAEFLIRQRRQP
jgi:signal transduction histidine kinase